MTPEVKAKDKAKYNQTDAKYKAFAKAQFDEEMRIKRESEERSKRMQLLV